MNELLVVETPPEMGDKGPEVPPILSSPEEHMSTTTTEATNGKTAPKQPKIPMAEFIRSRPTATVEEVIAAGKAAGLKISRDRVNCVRRLEKIDPKLPDRVKAAEVGDRRRAAGQKAAATKAAREEERKTFRIIDHVMPTRAQAKELVSNLKSNLGVEKQFIGCVFEIGIIRAEELLQWLRAEALKRI